MSAEAVAALRMKATELAVERDVMLRRVVALATDITTLLRAIAVLDPTGANVAVAASGRKSWMGAASLDGLHKRGDF